MLYGSRDDLPEPIELAHGGCLPMSRTRLILLGLLAVVAVSFVATASTSTPASASGSCSKVKTVPGYCVEGAPLESASDKTEGTNSGEATLKATIASVSSEIKCKKGKSKGTIEGGAAGTVGKSTATMVFEECEMITPTNCKLSAADEGEIETAPLKGELVMTSGRVEDKLESKTPVFATIEIEGKTSSCVIASVGKPKNFEVTGSQRCEVDSSNTQAETEAATHKLVCKYAGSSLEVGGKAEMASEASVKLTSGKNWSVKET
jgi:hypothetical protein